MKINNDLIKKVLSKKGWTIEKLASKTYDYNEDGLAISTINSLLRGNIRNYRLRTLQIICKTLDLKLKDLIIER